MKYENCSTSGNKKAYTLIELVASLAILAVIMSIGLASYSNFSNNQKLKQTALTFKNNLRFAQTNASTAKKPSDCSGKLIGYQVNFPSVSEYRIVALCTGGIAASSQINVILPAEVRFNPLPSTLLFKVLSRGLNISNSVNITFSGINKNYSLRLFQSGDITDLGFNP